MEVILSIIIINYKTPQLLIDCIQSIYKETTSSSFEIIVVDNASKDDSKDLVLLRFPNIRWIQNQTNEGFARANNIGIKESKGQYILLLNSDTLILNNAIDKSLNMFLSLDDNIAMLGCELLNEDLTAQKSRYYNITGFCTLIADNLFAATVRKYLFGKSKKTPTKILALMGAFLLFKRDILQECGYLDDDFFLYSEEIEWQLRIRKKGYLLYYFDGAKIIHFGEKSGVNNFKQQQRILSISLFFLKRYGRLGFILYGLIQILNIFVSFIYALFLRVRLVDQVNYCKNFFSLFYYYYAFLLKYTPATKKVNFLVKIKNFE